MTVANSIKAQLDEAEHVIRQQMARIAELELEVERLRSAAGAHEVLRSIYADSNQPTGHRIKAAGLAIGHEVPKIQSVPQPLDLTAEEVIPLADLVNLRRARQDSLCPASVDQRNKVLDLVPVVSSRSNGNGSDGDDTAS